jgi:hypothetical protein
MKILGSVRCLLFGHARIRIRISGAQQASGSPRRTGSICRYCGCPIQRGRNWRKREAWIRVRYVTSNDPSGTYALRLTQVEKAMLAEGRADDARPESVDHAGHEGA